ncbi:MAG: hypothetical protein IKB10_01820 [Alphaproteobacteria bacterium]|nr:hypothetical protein [Alphaproteobacteria bacterium]
MKNRVEPPVLISRVMTFVLAMSLVVLAVLMTTLYNLFPLNRPQIFFLTTDVRDNLEVKLVEMQPDSTNLDNYKTRFVREYIRHRNEIFDNKMAMAKKWNGADGAVRIMSSTEIYDAFANTTLFTELLGTSAGFAFNCPVIFQEGPIYLTAEDMYQVKIRYFCEDNTGRTPEKDYTIKLRIEADTGTQIKWADRIENPLGLRVTEYEVISGNGDPLDTVLQDAE